jgi:hypothetical protein
MLTLIVLFLCFLLLCLVFGAVGITVLALIGLAWILYAIAHVVGGS